MENQTLRGNKLIRKFLGERWILGGLKKILRTIGLTGLSEFHMSYSCITLNLRDPFFQTVYVFNQKPGSLNLESASRKCRNTNWFFRIKFTLKFQKLILSKYFMCILLMYCLYRPCVMYLLLYDLCSLGFRVLGLQGFLLRTDGSADKQLI